MLTREDVARLCPRPKKGVEAQANWDGYVAALTSHEIIPLYQAALIDTKAELCAFLANIAHETGGLTILWESLYYTSVGAVRGAWRKRASPYSDAWIKTNLLRNPESLGDWAYGGRMGNGKGNGDGFKYRGFGPLQTTGKTDHLKYLKGDYSYLSGLRAALLEWHAKDCGDRVNEGNFEAACILINGGTNGLAERRSYYKKAQTIWTADPNWPAAVAEQSPLPEPKPVTAADLVGVSRKISLLSRIKKLFAWTGVGSGGAYSLAQLTTEGKEYARMAAEVAHDNALLVLGIGLVVGFVLAHLLEQWIVEDANDGRYVPKDAPEGAV